MATLMAREPLDGRLRLKWTQAALEDALERGSLDPERHYEILYGDLYEKLGQGWPHIFGIDALVLVFRSLDPELFYVTSQTPLRVGQDLPEPDVKVLRGGLRDRKALASAEETLLVVEVSDTTLGLDTRVKAPIYASGGIPVYWIVDINRRRVEVHTRPEMGVYAEIHIFEVGEQLPPAFAGAPTVAVSDLFVPEEPSAA